MTLQSNRRIRCFSWGDRSPRWISSLPLLVAFALLIGCNASAQAHLEPGRHVEFYSENLEFGMSDLCLDHGIAGRGMMIFRDQVMVRARIASESLAGKKLVDISIATLTKSLTVGWNEMKRWNIADGGVFSRRIVVFREPSFWERTKWIWAVAFLIVLSLCALTAYLQYSRNQLKLARKEQRQLSGMLIRAEEQERRRIASELHDDFSQRIAVLSLGLENVGEALPVSFTDIHKQLRELVNSTSALGADLHTLSHRLHSSTLESLGLAPAVAALCKEFTAQQGIKIDLTSNEIPRSVHPDAALCMFRIVQEGLRNLKKHSGADEAQVDLRISGDRLEVMVRDEGIGFDSKHPRHDTGIGIRSMEERARSLGGEFRIHSSLGKGATLQAWVPARVGSQVNQ